MLASLRSRASPGHISITLILTYVVDWIILIATAVVGGVFSIITPNKRPFSLTDADISFPYVHKEKISLATLVVCGLVAPAIVIFFVALLLVPGPTVPHSTPKALKWRRKLWEWHTGWLGLGLSLAAAFLITNGMKNLFGKPRPDLLSRCSPDLSNAAQYAVGGFAQTQTKFLLVSATICTNHDKKVMNDGFRSFPSGHASFSSAGLIYLSLFLASKLAIRFPAFPYQTEKHKNHKETTESPAVDGTLSSETPSGYDEAIIATRNQAAAPPVYLLIIAVIPFFASIYISSTRWSDFRHHGFDILFGYFIGTVTAIFAFRYYHLPLGRGAGWAWGPRSIERSFWAGVGVGSYAQSGAALESGQAVANGGEEGDKR